MIPIGARAKEELHHLQHGHGDQCLQQRWDQLLESLQLHEPCEIRLMDSQLALLRFSVRANHGDGFNNQGLCGSSPFLLGLPLLLGGSRSRGFMMFPLSGFSLSSPRLLQF